MPTTRPFAYNTGSTVDQTIKLGNITLGGGINLDYSANQGNLVWWMGPDEDLGYVIAHESPGGQPNSAGKTAKVGFWRSAQKTDQSFIDLAKYVSNYTQNFTGGTQAKTWLNENGYWSTYETLAVDFLIVAGGAGSGADNRAMGGSGAGGFLSGNTTFDLNTGYTITVGAGGTKLSTSQATLGNKGNNSSISGTNINIFASGGGSTGGTNGADGKNSDGGSGGGASVFSSGISNVLGLGTPGQGNNGGNGCTSGVCGNRYAGGGGGAGAAGQDGNATNGGGDGGNGLTWYNGTTYAGGGGGSTYAASNAGTGGTGGGGNGTPSSGLPTNGGTNTGGGGGGGSAVNSTSGGGSGIVIIRYLGVTQKATGGTITTLNGYTYHTFTGTGTFTPTSV